eukprot:gnl/TRDRNA2_/TRDRNA2_184515_c0_seq1.p1 gnl/TRDRNA2_/TRDRNA2_184515_c0~~gnl/TRDRNA2_/TRDRNA2_184515_c0_seq1.p1  ORF type:complete len:114 (-),score=21.50 gnl/TRDRNA2_/TRDRNA2_184515_c0_seq1:64-405(-)
MKSSIPTSPMDIVMMLFKPPWVYIVIFIVLVIVFFLLHRAFKEQLDPVIFAVMDVVATIVRTCVSAGHGIMWITKRGCYPLKECIIRFRDSAEQWYRPWKKKRPYADIPTFQL